MKNKLISTLIIAMMLISCIGTAFASEDRTITVFVDGEQIMFDVHPISENGRTLVPVRYIFEALGADVNWIQEESKAVAAKDDITIEIVLNNNIMTRNGKEIALDVPAKAIDGRTLVPARAVAEALDAKVEWNQEEYKVIITSAETLAKAETEPEAISETEAEARKVAKEYMNSVVNLDIRKAFELSVNGEELAKEIPEGDFIDITIALLMESAEGMEEDTSLLTGTNEAFEEYLRILMEAGFDAFKKKISYSITDVREENGKYIYTMSLTLPNSELVESTVSGCFTDEQINTITQEVADELALSGKLTPTLTEDEIIVLMLVPMAEKIAPIMAEAIMNIETVTTTEELIVVNKDGKWLVEDEEFNMEDFDFSSLLGAVN